MSIRVNDEVLVPNGKRGVVVGRRRSGSAVFFRVSVPYSESGRIHVNEIDEYRGSELTKLQAVVKKIKSPMLPVCK